jgi:aryl-phospho-beta-D-glucosidase BglC (GH1 family)
MRFPKLVLPLLAACSIASTWLPGLASAAKAPPKAPRSFYGVIGDGPLLSLGGAALRAETKVMKQTGVASLRVALYWQQAEPLAGMYDFSAFDNIVRAATEQGITVLPAVQGTPMWANGGNPSIAVPPLDPEVFAAFLGEAVKRYGPGGSFWADNSSLKARPIRVWEVWNEPDHTGFFDPPGPWPKAYVSLLKPAYAAIKKADPGAKVMLAGLTNRSWEHLVDIYKAGGRKYFDIAAVHPFSKTVANVLKIVSYARQSMAKYGDAKKSLALTEVAWSSAQGAGTSDHYSWDTSEAGQAKRLKEVVVQFRKNRVKYRLIGFWWATWLSPQLGSSLAFDYTGLRRLSGASVVSKPALKAYRQASK